MNASTIFLISFSTLVINLICFGFWVYNKFTKEKLVISQIIKSAIAFQIVHIVSALVSFVSGIVWIVQSF